MRSLNLKVALSLACLVLAGGLSAAELIHNPVLSGAAGQDLDVQANLVGASGDVHVRLFYRPKGKDIYRSVEMGGPFSNLDAVIPGDAVGIAGLEYYIEASSIAGGAKTVLATAPLNNPALNPIQVAVRRDETAPEVVPLSPADGEAVDIGKPVITASYSDVDSGIDPSTVLVKIDGEAVKDRDNVQAFDTMVSYLPAKALADGEHDIVVVVKDKAGNVGSAKWHITVGAVTSTKVKAGPNRWLVDGRFNASTEYGAVLQQPAQPSTSLPYRPYGVNRGDLAVTARNDSETVALKVHKTDEERTDQQPVDRYTGTWKNRQGEIGLGDIAPSFSELSLDNVFQLRGLEFDLRSGQPDQGHTRLIGVWGQTRRAVDFGANAPIGSTTTASLPGTYAQYLYGARWEFGSPYFQMGLNSVSVNDDKASLNNSGGTSPLCNTLATTDVKIGLPFAFLTLNGETGVDFAASDPTAFGASVGSAYKAGLDWNIRPWGTQLKFDWRDLGGGFGFLPGGYGTLANPGLQGDFRGYTSSFSQRLLDGQFGLDVEWDDSRDNLQGLKLNTTRTDFLSLGTNIAPQGWPYLNVGYSQNVQKNVGDGDPATGDFKTSMVNVALGGNQALGEKATGSLNLALNLVNSADLETLRLQRDTNSWNLVLSGFVSRNPNSLTAAVNYGQLVNPSAVLATVSGTASPAQQSTATTISGGLRWNHTWTGTPLDSYLGYDLASYSQTSDALGALVATSNSSLRHTVSLGGGYKITGDQRLSLMLALALANTAVNNGGGDVNDSLTQLYSNVSYNLTF